MLGVYREARAVLDFNVLARQEDTVLAFQAVFVVDAGRAFAGNLPDAISASMVLFLSRWFPNLILI